MSFFLTFFEAIVIYKVLTSQISDVTLFWDQSHYQCLPPFTMFPACIPCHHILPPQPARTTGPF